MDTYRNFDEYIAGFSHYGEKTALVTRQFIKIERLNFTELQTKAYQVARYLSRIGIRPGQRIMVIGPNSPQWVELFLGAQLAGIIVVPVDLQSSIETIRRYAERTGPRHIFKSKYALTELERDFACHAIEALDSSIAYEQDLPPKVKQAGKTTALIIFTSGTTAEPKGVELTQYNLLSNVYGVEQALTIDPGWRLLSILPLSHMYELTGGLLAPLARGASIYYLPRITPLAIVRGLKEYEITTLLAVPQLLVQFLEKIRQHTDTQGRRASFERALLVAKILPMPLRRALFRSVHTTFGGHLNMVVTGGAPIPHVAAETWERMGVKVVQGYGLTETSPILSVNNPDRRKLDSQGEPLCNVTLKTDPSSHEILAKGPNVFATYWRNAKLTRMAFTDDGWFRTGDIGELKDGFLYIRGRSKFVITRSSGMNVVPEDIEVVAEKYPQAGQICIVGLDSAEGTTVHAVILSKKPDREINAVIEQINGQLESFQHIDQWTRWNGDDFPRTRLLKIDRRRVQEWANAHTLNAEGLRNTRSNEPQDDQVLRIVRLAIGKPTASIRSTDRLSDIGVDSLRRLAVVSLVEEQMSVSLNEADITQMTTLRDLRRLISSGAPAQARVGRVVWPLWPVMRFVGNTMRDTLVRAVLRIWITQRTEGIENLAGLHRPCLYIFNHVDDFDAPVVYKALPRNVRNRLVIAAADDVMNKHKMLAFVSRLWYASFNFARVEPIMPSLEYAATLIDRGWNVALAPEGKISEDYKLHEFKSGIGLLAVELGIPVVPVKTFGLAGTVPLHSKWPKKRSIVTVRIGSPVTLPNMGYDAATRQLHEIMVKL